MTTSEPRAANLEVARRPGNWSQTIDITLDVSLGVFTTLRDVAKISPVPYLSNAASIALSIVEVVQKMRSNKAAFQELAEDSCKIVCEIINELKDVSQPRDVPMDLVKNLEQLVNVLRSIEEFARKGASRNSLVAVLRSSSDARQIQNYRKKLYQAVHIFRLQSNIILRNTVAQLAANQVVMKDQLNNIARVLALPPCMGPSLQILTDILQKAPNDVSRVVNYETLFHFDNILDMDLEVVSTIMDMQDRKNLMRFMIHVMLNDLLRWSRLSFAKGSRRMAKLVLLVIVKTFELPQLA